MRKYFAVFIALIPLAVYPQQKPDTTVSSPLVVMNNKAEIIATCKTKQHDRKILPKAEDYYDCKLEGSHTLTELIQGTLRNDWAMQDYCDQEKRRILDEWKKFNDRELKTIRPSKKATR